MALRERISGLAERYIVEDSNSDEEEEEAKSHAGGTEPLINEIGTIVETPDGTAARSMEIGADDLFDRVKKSPEVLSIISTLVDDIISYGIDVEYVGRGDTPGTQKIADARDFIDSGFKTELEATLMDMLIMGDGYLYKRKVSQDEAKSFVYSYLDARYDFNSKGNDILAKRMAWNEIKTDVDDEDLFTTKRVQQVAASTMEHDINKHGDIVRFMQEVNQEKVDFDPDKIIHMPLMRLNGKTYGFTPLRSIISETDILANIKDTHGYFFSNAAVANKLWRMPEDGPDSVNYKVLKETLKKYRRMQNKNKDIVVTGEVEVEDLNAISDSMEFRNLAEYITNVIIMAWGVPPTRIGVSVSGDSSASRSATMTNEGYFKRISRFQDKIATILNKELFEPDFDVKIDFRDPDIRTEIKKADRDLRKTEVAKQRLALGVWGREKALEYLGVSEFEATDFTEEEMQQAAADAGGAQNGLMSDEEVSQDAGAEGDAAEKEQAADESPLQGSEQ